MVNHICWNPSFFPLPNADIHEISNFYQKRHLFIKNYSFFIKNLIDPPYKKLQPQISPFIKNSIFGNNRDPWSCLKTFSHSKYMTFNSFNNFFSDIRPLISFQKNQMYDLQFIQQIFKYKTFNSLNKFFRYKTFNFFPNISKYMTFNFFCQCCYCLC